MDIFARRLLNGQVAVVTGGGTGIGKGIATELSRAGADVVITSRKIDRLEATAEVVRADTGGRVLTVRADTGGRVLTVQADVRQRDQVQTMVDQTVNEFARLDIMVNNAAGNFQVKA
ncbi:MAG: SDR family NAD(P)-dependent oxidoreductase [Tepidiformaceae bacterium]